jgi:hypothetical protein
MIRYAGTNLVKKMTKIRVGWLVAIGLVVIAEAWRLYNYQHLILPGLELVTASTLVAAALLPRRAAVAVPLALMAGGDLILGNSPILFFTWSAFAAIGLAGLGLRRLQSARGKLVLASAGAGVAASVFFFLFTNFGVWLLGDGTMYAKTWQGLIDCYIMGLPFYRTNVLGNLVLVPAVMAVGVYGPALVASMRRRPATDAISEQA